MLQIFHGDGMALPRCCPPGYALGGNLILIAACRPAQEFVIEGSSYAHRFGNSN